MRLVIQRVLESSVRVDGSVVGSIGKGLMVLCGVEDGDTQEDVRYCVEKTANLRIFEDEAGKMNRSILDVGGEVLAISQFTLHGDVRRGRRPSFIRAARPETAVPLYDAYCEGLRAAGLKCHEPMGAFYVFPSIRETGLTSQKFCERLLMEKQVAVVPGDAFGSLGEGHIRCSCAASNQNIAEAVKRIGEFVRSL